MKRLRQSVPVLALTSFVGVSACGGGSNGSDTGGASIGGEALKGRIDGIAKSHLTAQIDSPVPAGSEPPHLTGSFRAAVSILDIGM